MWPPPAMWTKTTRGVGWEAWLVFGQTVWEWGRPCWERKVGSLWEDSSEPLDLQSKKLSFFKEVSCIYVGVSKNRGTTILETPICLTSAVALPQDLPGVSLLGFYQSRWFCFHGFRLHRALRGWSLGCVSRDGWFTQNQLQLILYYPPQVQHGT